MNKVTGPGLPTQGANYLYGAGSSLVAEIQYKSTVTSVSGKVLRTYEATRDMMTVVENKWPASTQVSRYEYGYDELGRREWITYLGPPYAPGIIDVWGYNDRNELIASDRYGGDPQVLDPPRCYNYDYDPIGNREQSTVGTAATVHYCANELNQYTALDTEVDCPTPTEGFTHDLDGNLTRGNLAGGMGVGSGPTDCDLAWDAETAAGRIPGVRPPLNPPATVIIGVFDAPGAVSVTPHAPASGGSGAWSATPAAHARFVWFGWLNLLELDALASNAYLRKQTWGLDLAGLNGSLNSLDAAGGIGGLLAVRDWNGTASTSDDKSYIYFYDGNGNVREMVDSATNAVAAHYEYDPYGAVVAATGAYAGTNAWRFSTKQFDAETGLGYWGYRWYDARMGRWMGRDPLEEFGGLSLYGFLQNYPSGRFDALGLEDYTLGTGPNPKITWDNAYPYDPKAKPTKADYRSYFKYGVLNRGAGRFGYLPDGVRAYSHYRGATGTDLLVDYRRAIAEDPGIKSGYDAEIEGAKRDIERLHDGKNDSFDVFSTSARLVNSDTENWQKALGGHRLWGRGHVKFDPNSCEYALTITMKMEDFYNFNKGQHDIATGLPDDENGRFEVFGWAKSFYSRAEFTETIKWRRGTLAPASTSTSGTRR